VDVDIPRNELVAVCGVSGSGKTSLALDTLYAEGQRRYIESFSAYTRQFLERLDKPEYDRIDGLPPALAVARATAARGNRSTVGTASDTLDYMRLLFARISHVVCYGCGQPMVSHSPQIVADAIRKLPPDCRVMLAFQSTWDDIAERASVLADLQETGFVRLISNNQLLNLGQDDRGLLAQQLPAAGSILVVADRLRGGDDSGRLSESVEACFAAGNGFISLLLDRPEALAQTSLAGHAITATLPIGDQTWQQLELSQQLRCVPCQINYPDPEPALFSFNSPLGACELCEGFGDTVDMDMNLIVPDRRKSIREGAIAPWNSPAYSHHLDELLDVASSLKLPVDVPFNSLSDAQIAMIREGVPAKGYSGLTGFFSGLERKKYKMHVRVFISRWRSYNRCAKCHGARLNRLALSYRIGGRNISQLCELEIDQLVQHLSALELTERQHEIARVPLAQLLDRLGYLQAVGLGYLTLHRTLRTLSGGEAQRTALTSALGSSLVNMLYVLDEPSVGLHPHDVDRLAKTIENLARRGNTVLMIEHEELLLERAGWLIEVGPAAGAGGGEIIFSGTRSQLDNSSSLTGDYLSGKRRVPMPQARRQPSGSLTLTRCSGNNLKNIDVSFPLGVMCVVSGVSGSGKSSLVQDTLYPALANRLSGASLPALSLESVLGAGQLESCVLVDQSPVSRSPRSNPVTYVKAFDEIRATFAESLDARMRNLSAGHFSFNSELGRCPKCTGDGVLQIDMQFLADISMTCPDCGGTRYKRDILQVKYRDRSIADVLSMTVREAQVFFRGLTKVQERLKVLSDVGLDYLQLGQSATTLSSGEAQRLKLAAFLANSSRKRTLFILDEPTTGLHTSDIAQLLDCFDALLSSGNSLIIVEHNLHLIAAADHIIDLGPGPAAEGGRVIISGTPEQVAACPESLTGQYLKQFYDGRRSVPRTSAKPPS
jgi:excinuclease ABC subunit A